MVILPAMHQIIKNTNIRGCGSWVVISVFDAMARFLSEIKRDNFGD